MLTLYGDLDSGNVYKVRLLLAQLGIAYRRVDTTQNAASRRRRNSARSTRSARSRRSCSMTRGYCRNRARSFNCLPAIPRSFPANAWDQANVLRCWIFFEQYSHEPHIAVNRHWKLHLPAAEQSRLADRFAQNHTRGEHALSVMEERLSESPWLAAGRYTIADIALCAHTHMAANGGFDLAPHPNGQSKTAEAAVVKQQFDSVWARADTALTASAFF